MSSPRQPAYDAVFDVIRNSRPRSTDGFGVAVENARVWRAVEAALDAMGIPAGAPPTEQGCPRCGGPGPGRDRVCAPCAADMGWDPRCAACTAEDRGEPITGMVHVPTCGPGREASR